MHTHQETRAIVDRGPIIVDPGPVSCADFPQDCAGAGHDIGDAEAVPGMDKFSAGDYRLAAGRKLIQGQKDRRGIIIDHNAGRAQQSLQQNSRMGVPPPLSACQVIFKVE